MSKHHIICKSKTLDVPIIVTSTISDSNDTHDSHTENLRLNENTNGLAISNKFKLDKGLSLDSHYLGSMSSSSSSSTNNINSSSTSLTSSTNSIRQQFLTPPPIINFNSNKVYNINADFDFDGDLKKNHKTIEGFDERIPRF
jgi:hypothetical protein